MPMDVQRVGLPRLILDAHAPLHQPKAVILVKARALRALAVAQTAGDRDGKQFVL
jgi:hypothetical protein